MDLEIRHLHMIDVLGAEGSFGKAATRLRMTQPALSRQITRIENHLGLQLVIRSHTGAVLTDAGRVVARHASVFATAFDELVRELAAVHQRGSTKLVLAASLNPAVTASHLLSEGYEVHVERVKDTAALAMVVNGVADIALVVEDVKCPYPPMRGIRTAVIMETPLWASIPAGHRLADRDRVSMGELAGEWWLMPSAGTLRAILQQACADQGFAPRVRLTGDIDMLLPAIGTGVGLGLNSPLCGHFFGHQFVVRPLVDQVVERKICAWRADRISGSDVRKIIDAQQHKHLELAPLEPQYQEWLARSPSALPVLKP